MHFARNQFQNSSVVQFVTVWLLLLGCFQERCLSQVAQAGGAAIESTPATHSQVYSQPNESGSGARNDFFATWAPSVALEEVIPLGHDIRFISRIELLPLVFQEENQYAGFYFGWGDVEFKSGSFPDLVIKDTWLLDVGIVARHYFTPPKTFLSPYATGGGFGQIMFWGYRTPINVGGNIIHSDRSFGGGGFIGLGLALGRKEHLSLYAETRLGMNFYDDATTRGFYNDLLEDYGYISFRAGVSFRF